MNSSTDLDPMAQMTNELEDLGNLFGFGDIDLNNITNSGEFGDHLQQQHGTHPNTPFQDLSEAPTIPNTSAHDFGEHDQFGMQNMDPRHYMGPQGKHAATSIPYNAEPMYQPAMNQPYNPHAQNFQYQPQQGFAINQHVPPTPNSYDMHGRTGHFMHQHAQLDPQQRAILEQRYQLRKDDAIAFTPMVSPAGTPQYNMVPEFTTPGAYFSPLTSPMLHAQNQQQAHIHHQQQQAYLTNPSTAPNSNTNSPIDPNVDVDMLADSAVLPESIGPQPRKSRRKIATPRNLSAGARVNQNQVQKPAKRKSTASSSVPPNSNNGMQSRRATRSQPASASLQMPSQLDSSEAESISPEPLSESVMGPPPRPGSSLNPSPALVAQQGAGASVVGAAATPKSLLTMRGNHQPINSRQDSTSSISHPSNEIGGIEDLSLPEAATKQNSRRPSLAQINTQIPLQAADDDTPRLSARKTPKLGPLSTPASARLGPALESPSGIGSPMTASTPAALLHEKSDGKGGRSNKRRGSISTNGSKLVSPALVPKISPGIKPLLPEGSKYNSRHLAVA